MSATGRSDVRLEDDAYVTPAWCVHRFLDRVQIPHAAGLVWMDPCAGEGAIIQAVEGWRGVGNKPGVWVAAEKREECREPLVQLLHARSDPPKVRGGVNVGDFLDRDGPARLAFRKPDVVIMNPPFSLAQEFIEECRALVPFVVVLLRVNYSASEKRAEFMRNNAPRIYVLPNRPQFRYGLNPETGKMFGTDATDYAWMVWTPDCGRIGSWEVLDSTPKHERQRPVVRRGMVAQ